MPSALLAELLISGYFLLVPLKSGALGEDRCLVGTSSTFWQPSQLVGTGSAYALNPALGARKSPEVGRAE